jgi:hypothetical protein
LKLLVVVALCLFAPGCTKLERVSQCRSLVETVNQGMNVIEPIAKGPDTPQKFAKLEREYRELAKRVLALPIASGPAQAEINEYTELLKSVSELCRNLGGSLANGGRTDSLRKDLDRATRRERLSANKLDTFCQAP